MKNADWRLVVYASFALVLGMLDVGITQVHEVGLQFLSIVCSQVAVVLLLFDGDSRREL